MKTIKIYDDEKEIYTGNCFVNTVIFKGRIYGEIKEISQNGIRFSIKLSNGKDETTGEWLKSTFADCVAFGELAEKIQKEYTFGDEIFLIAKFTSKQRGDAIYKNFVVREIVGNKEKSQEFDQQKIEKLIETDDLPF